ncbi:uncharacterized protein METZ01_LOCUS9058 [marine metagenome]|uniref:HD domain-containing protein n=1 Tax=marine metagenome TaxID=408172 RepID=A0A381NQ13_9ZZZZ
MLSNKSLYIHSMSVGLIMEAYAKKLKEDIEEYYIAGILHDADYEKFPDKHPNVIVDKLYKMNENKIAHAISCHYSKWNIKCKNNLDKYLLACDELTGFIVACSKVRPDGITSLKSKSVLKNLRKKSFAASVNRDEIYLGHNLIGIELSDHIDFIIEILKENSKILELKT